MRSLRGILAAAVVFCAACSADTVGTPAPALDRAGLRVIDMCAHLGTDVLGGVGTPKSEPTPGDWGSCSASFTDGSGKTVAVQAKAGWDPNGPDFDVTDKTAAGARILQSRKGDDCRQRVRTTDGDGIDIDVNSTDGDSCAAATAVTTAIAERVTAEPVFVTPAAGSLIAVDPCSLVGVAQIGIHECYQPAWRVRLGLGNRPDRSAALIPYPVAGITAYERAATAGGSTCEVQFMHREAGDGAAELVRVIFDESDDVDHRTACARAKDVLATMIPKLPAA